MANEKFQKALRGEPQKTPPVWMMRQAGRYHKHYQGLRQKHSFMELCKQPELAAEVALGPIEDFDFDVSIMFSDLLFPLEALGMGLDYVPGPQLGWQLDSKNIENLLPLDEAVPQLLFQGEVLKATRERLPQEKSLIGFVGGPWTLYTYAVEGAHKGNLQKAKGDFSLYQKFCERLLPLLKANIENQLESGAEVVMVFDTAAGELSSQDFLRQCSGHLQEMAASAPGRLGYYSKGTLREHLQNLLVDTQFAGFGFDHRWNLDERLRERHHGFVQGNFDQALLFSDESQWNRVVDDYLAPFKEMNMAQRAGWVCGLGHGVLPKTPEKHVREFVQKVREAFA